MSIKKDIKNLLSILTPLQIILIMQSLRNIKTLQLYNSNLVIDVPFILPIFHFDMINA